MNLSKEAEEALEGMSTKMRSLVVRALKTEMNSETVPIHSGDVYFYEEEIRAKMERAKAPKDW